MDLRPRRGAGRLEVKEYKIPNIEVAFQTLQESRHFVPRLLRSPDRALQLYVTCPAFYLSSSLHLFDIACVVGLLS
jgi:hypothetical protein